MDGITLAGNSQVETRLRVTTLDGSKPNRPKVGVVVPLSWEYSHRFFRQSIGRMQRWDGCDVIEIDGGTVYQLRNTGIEMAQDMGMEGVLFCDADMTFPPDALKRLVDHNLPIVGGLCTKRRKPFSPVLYRRISGKYQLMQPSEGDSGLFPVDATGGAFLYVSMEVFDKIHRPWFINREIEDNGICDENDFLGEDLNFCRKAQEAGYDIYVDLSLKIGHLVTGIVKCDAKNKPFVQLM